VRARSYETDLMRLGLMKSHENSHLVNSLENPHLAKSHETRLRPSPNSRHTYDVLSRSTILIPSSEKIQNLPANIFLLYHVYVNMYTHVRK